VFLSRVRRRYVVVHSHYVWVIHESVALLSVVESKARRRRCNRRLMTEDIFIRTRFFWKHTIPPRRTLLPFSLRSARTRRDEDGLAILRDRRAGSRPGGRGARDHSPGGERPTLRTGASGPSKTSPGLHGRGFPRSRNAERSLLTPPKPPHLARDSETRSRQVLQHHFPGRALHRDVAELTELPPETELLAAGFPCPVRSRNAEKNVSENCFWETSSNSNETAYVARVFSLSLGDALSL